MFILFGEDGYKKLISEDIYKKYNIVTIPVSYTIDGKIYVDSNEKTNTSSFPEISKLTVNPDIISYFFEKAVLQNDKDIVVLCPHSGFFPFKELSLLAFQKFRRTADCDKPNIDIINTKMLSVGIGALLTKSINMYESGKYHSVTDAINGLLSNSKTFIFDKNGYFYIKDSTVSGFYPSSENKTVAKCRNYIIKYELDYSVSSSNKEHNKKIINEIGVPCLFSAENGFITGSRFNDKTVISIF